MEMLSHCFTMDIIAYVLYSPQVDEGAFTPQGLPLKRQVTKFEVIIIPILLNVSSDGHSFKHSASLRNRMTGMPGGLQHFKLHNHIVI